MQTLQRKLSRGRVGFVAGVVAATLVTGCANRMQDAPKTPDVAAAPTVAERPDVLPQELRDAAYDAPYWGAQPPTASVPRAASPAGTVPATPVPSSTELTTATDALRGLERPITTENRAPRATWVPSDPTPTAIPAPLQAADDMVQVVSDMPNQAATPMPAAEPVAPVPTTRPYTQGAGYAVHLASYRQIADAEAGWAVLRADHPDVLNNLSALASEVDIPDRGTFYRLLVGPFAARDDAKVLCTQLKSLDEYCNVQDFSGRPIQ